MFTQEKMIFNGKIIDITVPISPFTPIFPGDPEPSIENTCNIDKDGFAVSRLSFGSHTGTHVDAPSHVLKNGLAVDNLNLESLMGQAIVLDFSRRKGELTGVILDKAYSKQKTAEGVPVLLLKTSSSFQNEKSSGTSDFQAVEGDRKGEFEKSSEDSVYLGAGAGAWIIRNGFKTVGIDSFSVDSLSSETLPAHHTLLSGNVNIVECLDLSQVGAGIYFFLCLPLKVEGCDGAPARAILIS